MDCMRTLQVMDTIGNINAVMVIHHTDCGGLLVTDAEVHQRMRERDATAAASAGEVTFGTYRQ
ncbi:uncharacterized protein HMPREF1541_08988 [Cyphellophora europaea CBS 101466]|uniref:Carbonate dehydratase n=1 Tax=Cyphellophora europaea (strain CBS 101466) TaxID=1220924 RepID=W2RK41_CYPE1|nr:uncharacterized protein HMPREF1541_08988 [Cyphellophora europaea CBS 101466]ETN36710.1 hypothetical protein HMPREF1541_08988 [Cyphellophora europaea CBS 101466]